MHELEERKSMPRHAKIRAECVTTIGAQKSVKYTTGIGTKQWCDVPKRVTVCNTNK